MFGCLASGRLVDTEPEQTDVNKFVFNLLDPDSINHLVVFMTGVAPFDEGYGASIFLGWSHPEPSWQLLGFLTNDKPSAIFRIQKTKPLASEDNPFAEAGFAADGVGISIEPLESLAQQTPNSQATPISVPDIVLFGQKVVESFFNYVASFSISVEEMMQRPQEQYVPMAALNKWHEIFMGKLELDPLFWKR